MKVPKPFNTLRRIIKSNQKTYIVTRPNKSVDSVGEVTETESTHNCPLWIQRQFEFSEMTDFGEFLEGDLYGVVRPSDDIQEGDRITHGGAKYEAETKVGHPSDDNAQYYVISFTIMR